MKYLEAPQYKLMKRIKFKKIKLKKKKKRKTQITNQLEKLVKKLLYKKNKIQVPGNGAKNLMIVVIAN